MVLVDYIGIFYISEYFWQMTVHVKWKENHKNKKINIQKIVINKKYILYKAPTCAPSHTRVERLFPFFNL